MSIDMVSLIIEAGAAIAAIAAFVAAIIMLRIHKKFNTGILADGFKLISTGVFFLAFGLLIEMLNLYLKDALSLKIMLIILKDLSFIIGTYFIVAASKKTGDKLESLIK